MARQSLKGGGTKIYEVINTFNKGYATNVADDIISENVFRDIENFLPAEEGNITKRPGINKMHLYEFIKELGDNQIKYEDSIDTNIALTAKCRTNFGSNGPDTYNLSVSDMLSKLFSFSYMTILNESKYPGYPWETFEVKNTANLSILENNKILNNIKDFRDILDIESNKSLYTGSSEIMLLFIFKGELSQWIYTMQEGNKQTYKTNAISIAKIGIKLDYGRIASTPDKCFIDLNIDLFQPYRASLEGETTFRYEGDPIIELTSYANRHYFMNGIDSLIQISNTFDDNLNKSVKIYSKKSTDIYKPTAIELSNIGFNIALEDPLTGFSSQGTADTIRGVFYTYQNEPIQLIPYNYPFDIHIISSGESTNENPQYRPNNGDTDTTSNPYKDLPGNYNSDKSVFYCTGLNDSGSYELKIKKGTNSFITYFTMGNTTEKSIGSIKEVSSLLFSSKYCRVIGNQLVLYGGHGYIFFSDYDRFDYFPNYYYVYAAETENEYVVSIKYFRQYYAVFTNKRIKRLAGSFGSSDFGLYPLNDFIGCNNANSIKQVQNSLYFLSDNGLYMLKQGYLGEGTENVEQIDLPIYKSYNSLDMKKACVTQNYYGLYSDNKALLFNFVNNAFYKLKYASPESKIIYSEPFQYMALSQYLYYICYTETDSHYDLCYQDYSEDNIDRSDSNLSFISSFETSFMSLGSPTNTKKFKEVYMKFYNKNGLDVPLYVTIKVDDITVVSPSDYFIQYDEETSTYSYIEKTDFNAEIKGFNVLGTLKLDEDVVGEKSLQILKLKVSEKGRAIKIIVSDGLEEIDNVVQTDQNKFRFDLATIGIVYKLKKVKEG